MDYQQYDNTNSGVLFRNDNRETENHPEFSGRINVNGVEYWLSAWVKTAAKTGRKYFSLSVSPKQKPPEEQASAEQPPMIQDDPNIPY
ncbi:MAG: hypothetical protein GY862_04405 [Gammaproteobacteria bacterium]|nr:hypothetical protein [Gammaproteobacteria bacterium]